MATSLRRDAVLLGLIHLANHALPLVVVPWLTLHLGPAGYGRYSLAIAMVWYFVQLADYGFNLTATHEISIARHDRAARSHIFWSVMAAKALLALVGACVLVLLAALLPALRAEAPLLAVAFLAVLGSVLTPVWYFQGLERLPVVAGVSLLFAVFSVPVTLWVVRSPDDLLLALVVPGLTAVLVGIVCLALLRKELAPSRVTIADVKHSLREGWLVFVSSAGVTLYTNTNTVVVGFIAGPAAAGFFAAADKLVRAVHALLAPIARVVFPRVAYEMSVDRAAAFALLRRLLRVQAAIAATASVALFLVAPWAVRTLFGPAFEPSVMVLQLMSPLPFIVALSNVFGVQTMLPLRMNREFSAILLGAGLLNLAMILPLTAAKAQNGAAISLVLCETIVTLTMFAWLLARRIPILGFRSLGTDP